MKLYVVKFYQTIHRGMNTTTQRRCSILSTQMLLQKSMLCSYNRLVLSSKYSICIDSARFSIRCLQGAKPECLTLAIDKSLYEITIPVFDCIYHILIISYKVRFRADSFKSSRFNENFSLTLKYTLDICNYIFLNYLTFYVCYSLRFNYRLCYESNVCIRQNVPIPMSDGIFNTFHRVQVVVIPMLLF